MTGHSPMSYTPSGAFSIPGSSLSSSSSNNKSTSLFGPTISTLGGGSASLSGTTPHKPLFKLVDTTSSTPLGNNYPFNASSSTSIPSLQQQQDLRINSMQSTTTSATSLSSSSGVPPSLLPAAWATPPSFFITSTREGPRADMMDAEPTETYNVAFGEGKSVLSLSDAEASGKYAGHKRESISMHGSERRVSFKTTREGSVDKGKGVAAESSSSEDETKIHVFGFTPDSKQAILDHFAKFGEILEHEQKGNWLTIRYASRDSAERSFESNGKAIVGDHIIGVTSAAPAHKPVSSEESARPQSTRVIPFGQAKDLYKKPDSASKKPSATASTTPGGGGGIGLGSGKAGLSVLGCPSVSPSGDITVVSEQIPLRDGLRRAKELLFEW